MKVAILAPPWFAVPPSGYGGIEWIVWLLAGGLVDRGHEVTLFASGDSHSKAKLEAIYPHAPSELIGRTVPELAHALFCYERSDEFDVINDHTGHLGAVLGGIEWIVWLLAEGLVAGGHGVTLFASGGSHSRAPLGASTQTI